MNEPVFHPIRLRAWRIVLGACLLAWFVKFSSQTSLFFQGPEHRIWSHPLIPAWLCRPDVGALIYLAPLLTVVGLFSRKIRLLKGCALLWTICSLLMLWHVQSYNDATHVTAFWCSLWLWWWSGKLCCHDEKSFWHGLTLGMGILSLCWLGGAMGKLTAEYWRGEPFYQLYILDKPQFPFSAMREHWSEDRQRFVAMVFSRVVIISELLLATSLLWPLRWAAFANIAALTGMIVISRLQLFSVLGSLMGLTFAMAWLFEKSAEAKSSSPS
jgi:hypothetical protein